MKKVSKTRIDEGTSGHQKEVHAPALRRADQVQALARLRRRIAEQTRQLAESELEARLLRLDIATELRRNGSTKTEAETLAKAHPRYIAHERGTLELSFARALSEAEAEALAFQIRGELEESASATTAQLAVVTLLAPWWAKTTPEEQRTLMTGAVRLVGLIREASPHREEGAPIVGGPGENPA